jgi:hypothetical protein
MGLFCGRAWIREELGNLGIRRELWRLVGRRGQLCARLRPNADQQQRKRK